MASLLTQKKRRKKHGGKSLNTPPRPKQPRVAPDAVTHSLIRHTPGGRKGGKFNNPDFRAPFFASDTLQSVAVAAVQEALCEGPVRGLVDGLRSFKLDGTPAQNADGSFNFPGIQLTMRYGYPDQDPIPGFARVRSEQPIGLEVLAPVVAENILTLTGNVSAGNFFTIAGRAYFFVVTLAAPDQILIGAGPSETITNIIAALTAGTGEGILYGSGTTANEDVTAEADDGDTMLITALTAGPAGNLIECETSGANLSWATPTLTGGVTGVTSRVTEQNLDAVGVKIRIPSLQFQDTETGDVTGTTLIIGVDIAQPDPNSPGDMLPFERVLTDTISGKASAPYDKSYRVELPSDLGPWDIRVVRDTPDSTDQNLQNRLFFSGLTLIKDVRLSYPDTCIAGINIDARQFGSNIPSRTYEMYGLLIDVPSNYDTETRVYTGIWDGEFKTAWTDNPAWILYALLTNTRWGIGQYLDSTIIDKFGLYAIGQYCDEKVPTGDPGRRPQFIQSLNLPGNYNLQVSMQNHGYVVGDTIQILGANADEYNGIHTIDVVPSINDFTLVGPFQTFTFDNNPNLLVRGTEPRYTCSILLNTFEDAFAAVQAIASNMRAIVYWGAGQIRVSQDSPADPVIKASPANVEGKISYSGTSVLTRYNRARVMWADPEDSYRQHPEVYEDKDAIERDQLREITLFGVGVTRRGHAHRIAKFFVDASQNASHIAKYVSGLDHAFHENVGLGSIVELADTRIAGLRIGGRLAGMSPSTDPTQITLDYPADLSEADQTFVLSVIMPDGIPQEREITNPGGASVTALELASALDGTPLVGAMWSISSASLAPAQYRIMEIAERGNARLSITAAEHDPTKYDRIELGLDLPLLDFTDLPSGQLDAPLNLVANETLARIGANIVASVTLSWTASTDPRAVYYESEVKRPGSGVWERMGFSSAVEHTLNGYVDGVYDFRVRALDSGGANKSPWAELLGRVLLGLSAPPADVENFEVSVLTDAAQLTWSKVPDLDLDYYQIRYQPVLEGATWAGAQPIANQIDGNTTTLLVPAIPGTYLIKAVDLGGYESRNATLLVMNTPSLIGFNAIASLEDDPDFLGVMDEVNVVTRAATPGLELAFTDSVMADWPTLSEVLTLAGGLNGFEPIGYYYFEDTIDLGGIFTCRITSDIIGTAVNINNVMAAWETLASVSNLAGVVEGETGVRLQIRLTDDDPAGTPTWGEWRDFVIGDYVFRGAECRLVLETIDPWKTPRITRARVYFDMPDRTAGDNNLTSSVSGSTITFQPAFKDVPAIAINGQSMSTGDRYAVTAISRTAFTVTFYDSGGTPVVRTFDWIAQGWGWEY